jgi:NAD(P)H dehydrogenase (quinone)
MQLNGSRVLAFGTAGAQGSGIAAAASGHGAQLVRATSRPDRAAAWRDAGEQAVVADLTDVASVAAAAADVDAVVLHLPVSLTGAGDRPAVVRTVEELRRAGRPVTVNVGAPVPPAGAPDPLRTGDVAARLRATGAVVLTPTVYLENHAAPWAIDRLAAGELVYPRPAADRLAWIAAADLGAAALAALAADIEGELLALAGPQVLSFDELAGEFSAGLGRPVAFRRVSPAEYGDLLRPVLGPEAAAGVEAMYDAMPATSPDGMRVDATDTWKRLGVAPTTARAWAATVLPELLTR